MSKSAYTAPCRFCGQITQFEAGPLTREQEIEEATMRCDCGDAALYQIKKEQERKALENIRALFGSETGEDDEGRTAISILNAAVSEILEGKVEKITLNLTGGIKAIISVNRSGEIKVERVETKKRQLTG